jgi:integrase
VLDEAVRDGIVLRNPAKDRARRRTMGIDTGNEVGANPRDLALPDVATLHVLVERVAAAGGHNSHGDLVTILATTALRISEVSGRQVGDVDLESGLLSVSRQTYPGCGGVVTTAFLRDATGWDELASDLGLAGLVRHGPRHTALTWMTDAGVDLHLLQRVAGHQAPAVTARYLHPDHAVVLDVGRALSAWWARQAQPPVESTNAPKPAARSGSGPTTRRLGIVRGWGLGT